MQALKYVQCLLIFIALTQVTDLFIERTGKTTQDSSYGSYSVKNADEESGT